MLENILVRPIFGFFSVYYSLKNEMKADPPCSLFPMFCSLFPVFCSLFCDPCPFLLASYFLFLHPSPISFFILTNSSFSTRHSLASHSPLTRHSLATHSPLTHPSFATHLPLTRQSLAKSPFTHHSLATRHSPPLLMLTSLSALLPSLRYLINTPYYTALLYFYLFANNNLYSHF